MKRGVRIIVDKQHGDVLLMVPADLDFAEQLGIGYVVHVVNMQRGGDGLLLVARIQRVEIACLPVVFKHNGKMRCERRLGVALAGLPNGEIGFGGEIEHGNLWGKVVERVGILAEKVA